MKSPFPFVRTPASLVAAAIALALALGGCSGSNSSSSQSGTGYGASSTAGTRHRMGEALASLGLSDSQKSQIRDIMKAARARSVNADPATRRENFRAAMQKIQSVLTPDQRAKLKAKLAQMRAGQGTPPQS